jgi:hypothetical protein
VVGGEKEWPFVYAGVKVVPVEVEVAVVPFMLDGSVGKMMVTSLTIVDVKACRVPIPYWTGNSPSFQAFSI